MKNRSVVAVVGGGVAGWLAACHIAKIHSPERRVVLIEDPDIPPVGVGEGTVPAFRESLRYLGISETDLICQCDATFKQSVKFVDWNREVEKGDDIVDFYHHVFDYPFDPNNLVASSIGYGEKLTGLAYADLVGVQSQLCELGLAPKTISHAEFDGVASYAYHFDAAKFSQLLKKHGVTSLGVEYLPNKCLDVDVDDTDVITRLKFQDDTFMSVDFVVDATGFSSSIFGGKLGVGFEDKSKCLFVDNALAAQIEYPSETARIPCSTLATAKSCGWIWDIGLSNRRGVGFAYSSAHCSDEEAANLFDQYIGDNGRLCGVRKIPMRIGHRENFWVGNCAAIGLSQGFVEPLEATGLLMFDATSRLLAQLLPAKKSTLPAASRSYNKKVRCAWENVIDFIKLHYCISRREDSDFWRDNRAQESIPTSLMDLLEMWKERIPIDADFGDAFSIFHKPNYNYILFGMRHGSEQLMNGPKKKVKALESRAKLIASKLDSIAGMLSPHRELIDKIKRYGLQVV